MDYTEFKRQVQKAGLTINEFSALIRVRPNSTSNFAKKPVVPETYAALAVLCAEFKERGIDFLELLARKGIHAPSPAAQVTSIEDYRKRNDLGTGPKP